MNSSFASSDFFVYIVIIIIFYYLHVLSTSLGRNASPSLRAKPSVLYVPPRLSTTTTTSRLSTTMATTPALRGTLRNIRLRPATHFTQQRLFAISTRYQANEKQQQSFKSQLYESTQERLKRERAEQERFARYQTQSPGGRYAALVFGAS